MNRREFILICGCVGLGTVVGTAPETGATSSCPIAWGNDDRRLWMRGSVKTGCARLPSAELHPIEIDPVIVA